MKIHYSPYFNGKAYIDYANHQNGGLLGECVESSAGLLSRLELIAGLSYPDSDDNSEKLRQEAYFKVLKTVIGSDSPLLGSFTIDVQEPERKYRVTKEMLSWRDNLILSGWDKVTPLPGKLAVISEAEKNIGQDSAVKSGEADRWVEVYKNIEVLKAKGLEIEVHCPEALIPSLICKTINAICTPSYIQYDKGEMLNIDESHCKVLSFNELTDAYEWIAQQEPNAGEVIVCNEDIRLDSTMRAFNKPVANCDNPAAGSHHIIKDIRCLIDMPSSLIWLDCNGDYGFSYPYSFITSDEMKQLDFIPSKEKMLEATHASMVYVFNRIEKIILVSSNKDNATTLSEHPFVSAVLHPVGMDERKPERQKVVFEQTEEKTEKRFTGKAKKSYELGTDAYVDIKFSQSSIGQLINLPLDYVIERTAGLREPYETSLIAEKGSFAHAIVEYMVNEYGQVLPGKFDVVVEKVKKEKGKEFGILLSEENFFSFEGFIREQRTSIAALTKLIEDNSLTPVGCEINIEGYLDGIGETIAKVDMILKKSEKEYVIFDFKNSTSSFYFKKLAIHDSVQLDFYKESFEKLASTGTEEKYKFPEDAKIVAYGYYQFPLCKLYVPEGELGSDVLGGDIVEIIPLDTDNAITDPIGALKENIRLMKENLQKGEISHDPDNDRFPNHIVLKDQLR